MTLPIDPRSTDGAVTGSAGAGSGSRSGRVMLSYEKILELVDVDIARFSQLWALCIDTDKDRFFEQMPESWKYVMTSREIQPDPKAESGQQVQRRLAR